MATFLHSDYFKEQDFGSSRYKLLSFFIRQHKIFSTLGLVSAIIIKVKKEVIENGCVLLVNVYILGMFFRVKLKGISDLGTNMPFFRLVFELPLDTELLTAFQQESYHQS